MKLKFVYGLLLGSTLVYIQYYILTYLEDHNKLLFKALYGIKQSKRPIRYSVPPETKDGTNDNESRIQPVKKLHSNVTFMYEYSLQSVNSTTNFPPRALWSNLRQFNEGIVKVPIAKLKKSKPLFYPLRLHKQIPPLISISDLRFDVALRVRSTSDVSIRVTDRRNNATVRGCNFSARRVGPRKGVGLRKREGPVAGQENERLVAECSVEELSDHSHSIICPDYSAASSPCYQLTIRLQYCNYQAYINNQSIVPYNHTIFEQKLCSNANVNADSHKFPHPLTYLFTPPSWTTTQDGRCKELILDKDEPVRMMSPDETCACVKSFSNVYLIGTSHMRFFGDYLMHTCYGRNLSGIEHHHDDLETETVHYLAWAIYKHVHKRIPKYLDAWLVPNTSIAIWLQLGSWDFSAAGVDAAIDYGLPLFNNTLAYIKSHIAAKRHRSTTVDLRVLGSPAMPVPWHRNNFAVAAFNAKLEMIVRHHGVHYTDVFSQTLPCIGDLPVPFSPNHYFYRDKENHFDGQSGKNIYFGAFLPQVCPFFGYQ